MEETSIIIFKKQRAFANRYSNTLPYFTSIKGSSPSSLHLSLSLSVNQSPKLPKSNSHLNLSISAAISLSLCILRSSIAASVFDAHSVECKCVVFGYGFVDLCLILWICHFTYAHCPTFLSHRVYGCTQSWLPAALFCCICSSLCVLSM